MSNTLERFDAEVQGALEKFNAQSVDGSPPLFSAAVGSGETTPFLLRIIQGIADFGVTPFSWALLKPLITSYLAHQVSSFAASHEWAAPGAPTHAHSPNEERELQESIMHHLNDTPAAPFTLQRIAEVLLAPESFYSHTRKLLRALSKLTLVTATIHHLEPQEYDAEVARLVAAKRAITQEPVSGVAVMAPDLQGTPPAATPMDTSE